MLKRLSSFFPWLITALLLVLPLNLFLVLNEPMGYSNGLRVDYLLPKLFLSDLIIVPIIIIGVWEKRKLLHKHIKKSWMIGLLLAILLLSQIFSSRPLIGAITILKGLEISLLFLILLLNRAVLKQSSVIWAATFGILMQTVFALYQFVFQKSLTPYWLVGESNLNSGLVGLARTSYAGEERLLAYGTTAHPNILAGISILLLLFILSQRKQAYFKSLLVPVITVLFLTQSWSATFALIIGLLALYLPKIFKMNIVITIIWICLVIPFFMPFLNYGSGNYSISRRVGLMDAALKMIESKPLFGVGLNNFTVVLEEYSTPQEFVRFVQPVHNSLWLYLAETGVVGLLLFWRICKKCMRYFRLKPVALALIPLLSLDHYLTTNQTGLLMLTIFICAVITLHTKEESLNRHSVRV